MKRKKPASSAAHDPIRDLRRAMTNFAVTEHQKLMTQGHGYINGQRVKIIAAPDREYRILADMPIKLRGRHRMIRPGETALVARMMVTTEVR